MNLQVTSQRSWFLAAALFAIAVPWPSFAQTTLHFHGNVGDIGPTGNPCTGTGAVDLQACGGPFLTASAVLSSAPAAHWDVEANAVSDDEPQSPIIPNWTWYLSAPTTVIGYTVIQFWASCAACNLAIATGDWTVTLYADGVNAFSEVVSAFPALPGIPSLLTVAVTLPPITAGRQFNLQIAPNFIDAQTNTHIYYDSQSPCPTAMDTAACDSSITFGATPPPPPPPPPSPAVQGGPGFTDFPAPASFSQDYAEPSIDVNRATGSVFLLQGLETARARFDDSTTPATVTWADKTGLLTSVLTADPGMTDDPYRLANGSYSPRITVIQDVAATTATAYSDDDGESWQPSSGAGQPYGFDHPTVGAGPYPLGFALPHPLAEHAVYICSQEEVNAFCSRSDDGGVTFNPSRPIYGITDACGIHGHVKVAPDGTVYVPFKNCEGHQGVAVSTDAGETFVVRTVPGSVPGYWDAAVGIASDDTVYFGYMNGQANGTAHIAVSHNRGATWDNDQDVGVAYGLKNIVFPAVVAGDPQRAAFAFHGTTTAGDSNAVGFDGVWNLYVATTLDGGSSWSVNNATPGDPVQIGDICAGGTGCGSTQHRNLLDFFGINVDAQGRILVGFTDGCTGDCPASGTGNFSQWRTIARQADGLRLLSAFDPAATATLTASASSAKVGDPVTLTWSSSNATTCSASGDWTGAKTPSGSETVTVSKRGVNTFSLSCTAGSNASPLQTIAVTGGRVTRKK